MDMSITFILSMKFDPPYAINLIDKFGPILIRVKFFLEWNEHLFTFYYVVSLYSWLKNYGLRDVILNFYYHGK